MHSRCCYEHAPHPRLERRPRVPRSAQEGSADGRATDEYLQTHALESFVERLAASESAGNFTLKGGVLLSAFHVRRPTRDVDLSSHGLSNDLESISAVIQNIARMERDDGWELLVTGAEPIREEAAYAGARVSVRGVLASARQDFHVDVSFGDPVRPAPALVTLERLLGGTITLRGYPLSMVLAEKLTTALQRGASNTRWRDYADAYRLSRAHSIEGHVLAESLRVVAAAREAAPRTLAGATAGFAPLAQGKWAAWVRKQKLTDLLPLAFSEVIVALVAFVDPVLDGSAAELVWDSTVGRWIAPVAAI